MRLRDLPGEAGHDASWGYSMFYVIRPRPTATRPSRHSQQLSGRNRRDRRWEGKLWQGEVREVTRCEVGEHWGLGLADEDREVLCRYKRAARNEVRRRSPDLDPVELPEGNVVRLQEGNSPEHVAWLGDHLGFRDKFRAWREPDLYLCGHGSFTAVHQVDLSAGRILIELNGHDAAHVVLAVTDLRLRHGQSVMPGQRQPQRGHARNIYRITPGTS